MRGYSLRYYGFVKSDFAGEISIEVVIDLRIGLIKPKSANSLLTSQSQRGSKEHQTVTVAPRDPVGRTPGCIRRSLDPRLIRRTYSPKPAWTKIEF
jgi:hypothetical protein